MKKLLLFCVLLPVTMCAQDFELLKNIDKIEIKQKTLKLKETEKHFNYITEVTYRNVSDKDIYYAEIPPASKNGDPTSHFASVSIQNVTNLLSQDKIELLGEKTNLSTNRKNIYVLPANKEFQRTLEYKIKKEISPVITARGISDIKFVIDIYEFL